MNLAKTFFALLAMAIALPLFSTNLYIQYDPECMNRLEYVDTGTEQGSSYIVYQVQVNENEKLILEVGLESQRYQNYLPTNAINCTNAIYSREMATNINQQIDQVFIVYQKGRKQYFVSPVSFAAYYVQDGEKMSYSSPQYQFELNLRQGIIGENIALNRQRAEVFFDGRLENQCSGAYVFRQFSLYTSNPHMDIIIVPEVGIVEVRNGRNAEDALQNIRRLEKVNNQYLSDHMDMVCLGIMPETTAKGGVSTIYEPQPTPQNLPVASDLQARSPLPLVASKKYVVKKKETLFGIAKANKVSLADLRKWNNLENSNMIRPGDQLWLGPPVDERALNQPPTDNQQIKGGDGLPAPYNVPGTEKFAWGKSENPLTEKGNTYWEEYPGEYVVQPGETVASIARKFGFTETRFRTMNKLNPAVEVKIGQRLITSDCAPGAERPAPYDASGAAYTADGSEDFDLPPYESKIIPTTDYYYNQQQQQQNQQARSSTKGRTAPATFEPYSSNTPSFYETPEATRIRTASRSTFNLSPTSGGTTATPNRPSSYSDVPVGYDMSTLPQSYDRSGTESGASTRTNRTLHFVKDGETLYDIARLYGTTVERIRKLNQIELGETIMPYQQIYVN